MKGLFGMLSLLAALLIVAMLVKQQLDSSGHISALESDQPLQATDNPANTVEQYKSAVEQALNQQRPMPKIE